MSEPKFRETLTENFNSPLVMCDIHSYITMNPSLLNAEKWDNWIISLQNKKIQKV